MAFRPLFIFGVARGGTNLVARMLGAHPRIEIMLDPLLPVFRSYRNAIVRRGWKDSSGRTADPRAPFQDYYGGSDEIRLLDLILSSDLSFDLDEGAAPELRVEVVERAALESPRYAHLLGDVEGRSFQEFIAAILERIASRGNAPPAYAGTKEVWTVEYLAPLARAFPSAKFIAIERDPRDVILSLVKMGESDPTQVAHTISYMRHWRKHVVVSRHLRLLADLEGRLMLVSYEALASDPEKGARDLCRFLEIDFDPAMIRLGESVDRTTGERWKGNSSFEADSARITPRPVGRWRRSPDDPHVRAVEFVCGPEMALCEYPVGRRDSPEDGVLDYFLEASTKAAKWRSDSGDVIADFGLELFRRAALRPGADRLDEDTVRRAFLFRWAFDEIRAREGRSP